MRVPRAVVALLVVSSVLAGMVLPAGASGASPAISATNPDSATVSAQPVTPTPTNDSTPNGTIRRPDPRTVITINVTADGDARWTVTSRFVVETPNETAAFEALADRVDAGDSDLGYSVETFRTAAELAEASTGRSMAIENTTWTSDVVNETGTISLRFTWRNFATVESGRVVVGDAFSTGDGTWLPRLLEGQKLVVNPPPEYAPIDTPSDRGPVDGSLIWHGPRKFEAGYFSIVYRPVREIVSPTPTTVPGTTPPGGQRGTSPWFWLGVGLLVAAVGAGGYFYAMQRREDGGTAAGAAETTSEGGSATTERTSPAESNATGPEATAESPEPSSRTISKGTDAAGTAAVDDAEPAGEEHVEIDPELLSDEERVERLLERNGGRMKQANIVEETGWSNAKVSQLLSSMAEEERINKLRIGRENLITLPDEDVTDF